jgi:hypothetical protein
VAKKKKKKRRRRKEKEKNHFSQISKASYFYFQNHCSQTIPISQSNEVFTMHLDLTEPCISNTNEHQLLYSLVCDAGDQPQDPEHGCDTELPTYFLAPVCVCHWPILK